MPLNHYLGEIKDFEIESILANEALSLTYRVAPCNKKNSKNFCSLDTESKGKFLLMESGIQLKESRILLKIEIQNPCSTEKTGNPESTTCNLESKTVLDFLIWGEIETNMGRNRGEYGANSRQVVSETKPILH